jgi:hypothetical protein
MLVFLWFLVEITPVFKPEKRPIAAGLDAKNSCSNDFHSLAMLAGWKGSAAKLQVAIGSSSMLQLTFVLLIIKRPDWRNQSLWLLLILAHNTQAWPSLPGHSRHVGVDVVHKIGYGVRTPFGTDWQFFETEITDDNISSMYELLQLLRVVWKTFPSNILQELTQQNLIIVVAN